MPTKMYFLLLLAVFQALVAAAPLFENSNHFPAEPFTKRASFPQTPVLSGEDIFRRQGCPGLSLLCPSGGCCSYETIIPVCCGDECCADGYICSGGTVSNPCCVAIGDLTSTCGGANTNPCVTDGYLPCVGVDYCCPSDTVCYYDGFNTPQCNSANPIIPSPTPSPPPPPPPSPTPDYVTPTPDPTPDYVTPTPDPTPDYVTPTPDPTPDYVTPTPNPTPDYVTPTPIPSPGPVVSPAPVNKHTDKKSFWTPAVIGGISAGGAVLLIIIIIVIWWCIKKKKNGGTGGGWVHRQYQLQPLSDAQIYWLVKDLETTDEWQDIYDHECKRAYHGQVADPTTWMENFAVRAVTQRIHQLRTGGQNASVTFLSSLSGFVPFLKIWAVRWGTKLFNNFAIDCLGMGNTPDVNELVREADSKAGLITNVEEFFDHLGKTIKKEAKKQVKHAIDEAWMNSDLREHLKNEIQEELIRDYGVEAANEFAEEAIHLKAGFGQLISMGRAAYKANDKMDRALELLDVRATYFHLRVFVVNALARTIPSDDTVESKY